MPGGYDPLSGAWTGNPFMDPRGYPGISGPAGAAPVGGPIFGTPATGKWSPTATTAPTGTVLPGAAPQSGVGPYGAVPQVPSPVATAGVSIAGNQANLPALGTLATGEKTLADQLAKAGYVANLPDYQNMLQTATANTGSLLHGQIPQDVMNEFATRAAERGVNIGSPGSPNANAALMQAVVLDSLGLQREGLGNLRSLVGMTPVGATPDITSQQTTAEGLQAAQMAANKFAAAPNPAQAALANLAAINAGKGIGQGSVGPTSPGMPATATTTGLPNYNALIPQAPTSPGATAGTGTTSSYAPPDTLVDPYSLGGYNYGGGVSEGLVPGFTSASSSVIPGPAEGDYRASNFASNLTPTGVDQLTQDFMDAYDISWGMQ